MATTKKPSTKTKAPAPKEKKTPAAKPATEKAPRKPGVGSLTIELILAGKTTGEILEAVQKAFPESKASNVTISWYRGKLKKEGKL